jgi:hypothetical protein
MSRMFHRVLLASAVGAAALAAPGTALAAASGPGGGADAAAQTPTSVVLHLPQHVMPGQPVMVTARVAALDAARDPGAPQSGKDGSRGKGKGTGRRVGGKGHGTTKSGAGHRKGAGPGTSGAGHGGSDHHPVTGEVVFFLDGRAEPPAEISRGLAGEKLDIPLGRHTLLAEYTGDPEYQSARSAPVTFELTAGQPVDGQGQRPQGSPDGGDDGQDQGGYGQDQGGYGQGQDGYGQDGYGNGDGQDQDGPGAYAPEQGSGAPGDAEGTAV